MAAPTLQGSSAIAAGTTTATITPTLPAHVADDILVVHVWGRANGMVFTMPAGWAPIDELLMAGMTSQWYWLRATGTMGNPAITVTTGSADHYAQAHVIRGCITTGNPWDAYAVYAVGTGDPSTPAGSSVTTTVADTLLAVIGGELDNVAVSVVVTATDPASIGTASSASNRYVVSPTGADGACYIAAASKASTGDCGLITFNWSAVPDGGQCMTVAFKPPAASGPQDVTLTGIASQEAFGALTVSSVVTRTLTGIASEETFGTTTATAGTVTKTLTGIASEEAFGSITASPGAVSRTLTGIASEETFGTLSIATPVTRTLTGIASEEAFGTITTATEVTRALTGIASEEAFGTLTVSDSSQTVTLTGIASEETFGTLGANPGAVTRTLTGIASEETFGTTTATGSYTVSITGVASEEAFGTLNVTSALTRTVTGIASEEAIGSLTISSSYPLALAGIASEEEFGNVTVTGGVDPTADKRDKMMIGIGW